MASSMQNMAGSGKRAGSSARRRALRLSARDAAYEAIKHNIITCKFKPGECINEASVSALLGFGRTSVNKALDRLMLEEMVEVIPRKGVIVKPVILHEVLQMIDARLVNEVYCARLAAQRADNTHIERLADIVGRARRSLSEGRLQLMMLLDREFHSVLASATKNDEFTEVLRKLSERSLRFWFISFTTPEQVSLQEQHEAIFAAVKAHDEDGAEAAMRTHIEAIRKGVARQL
jgi:GntR family transcriptional regulator, rspAB operon transcriptional repressor